MADKDDVPELPPGVDKRALERAAVAHYSNPDRISTMPNDWIVTYGRAKNGKLCIQLFRKVFGSPKVASDFLEVTKEELQEILRQRGVLDDDDLVEDESEDKESEDEEDSDEEDEDEEDEDEKDAPFGDGETP